MLNIFNKVEVNTAGDWRGVYQYFVLRQTVNDLAKVLC